MVIRTFVGALVVLLLAGCTASPTPDLAPKAAAAAPNTGSVGTRSAELAPVAPQIPPVRVRVPTAGIDASVTPVGVQPDGFMEVPENVAIAGWYKYGSDPASVAGTTVIAGHVDSLEYGLGPFAALKSLAVGTQVIVTTNDGVDHRYLIESVHSVVKSTLPLDEVFDRSGQPRLILITCGGQFDYVNLNYSDNVLAVALPERS